MSEPELQYEEARDELRSIVQKLESGQAPLAESLALWERGEKLAAVCQQWLDGAEQRIASARAADTEPRNDVAGTDGSPPGDAGPDDRHR